VLSGNQAAPSTASDASKKRKLPTTVGNSQFQVYEDENDDVKSALVRSEGGSNWGVLGAEATKEKENTQAPSKWTGHKVTYVFLFFSFLSLCLPPLAFSAMPYLYLILNTDPPKESPLNWSRSV
jgi:hypothetical protein